MTRVDNRNIVCQRARKKESFGGAGSRGTMKDNEVRIPLPHSTYCVSRPQPLALYMMCRGMASPCIFRPEMPSVRSRGFMGFCSLSVVTGSWCRLRELPLSLPTKVLHTVDIRGGVLCCAVLPRMFIFQGLYIVCSSINYWSTQGSCRVFTFYSITPYL